MADAWLRDWYRAVSLRCERCNRSLGDTRFVPKKCPHCGGKLR